MVIKDKALIPKGMRRRTEQGPMLFGVDLQDVREEIFVRMVTDGIAMGVAFKRAGFNSKHTNAPSNLWQLPRVQERANAILEARRNTGVVTLPDVTSMLQRVYSSAYHADEFNAAHNAALSLARLYGHVNDRQTLEVIRRPSRDPDAPSEQELSSWVESLPAINAPDGAGFSHSSQIAPMERALSSAPAAPLATLADNLATPADNPATPGDSAAPLSWGLSWGPNADSAEKPNDISSVRDKTADTSSATSASDCIAYDGGVPGRPENGAPTPPVTGTPTERAHSEALKPEVERVPPPGGVKKKRVPRRRKRVPVKKREKPVVKLPSAKDLFG